MTGEVPKAIYEIPVSSPSYAVTYVTVEESNNDAVVFATAMAFTGVMVAWGCVVWGTGYYYPPYYGYGGGYPYYYPHYPTYGYGASYNPWTGAYTRGAVAYGPYGGAGVAQRYNPRTGTYSRGAVAYGPYGVARCGVGLQPAHRRVGRDAAGFERLRQLGNDRRAARRRLGQDVALHQQRDRQYDARHEDEQRRRLRRARRQRLPQRGRQLPEVQRQRRTGAMSIAANAGTTAGTTQTRDRATTSGMDSSTRDQVTRDSAARAEGAQRTRDSSNVRSGSSGRTSSYRPSGGGRAGGGGGRRR